MNTFSSIKGQSFQAHLHQTMKCTWDQFDIYCINLKSREDRHCHVTKLFKTLGIECTMVRVDKHDIPKIGLLESCCLVFEMYLASNTEKHLLLFEDDIIVGDATTFNYDQINRFMRSVDDWDVLRLGMNKGLYLQEFEHAFRCNALGNHAIVYNKCFVKVFLEYIKKQDSHVDWLVANATGKCYILKDQLFFQGNYGTDNFWGELEMNEFQIDFQKCPIEYQKRYACEALTIWKEMKNKGEQEQIEMFKNWFQSESVVFENKRMI